LTSSRRRASALQGKQNSATPRESSPVLQRSVSLLFAMSASAAQGRSNFSHSATARRNPRSRTQQRNEGVEIGSAGSSQVAHTLTACTRCRTVGSQHLQPLTLSMMHPFSSLKSILIQYTTAKNKMRRRASSLRSLRAHQLGLRILRLQSRTQRQPLLCRSPAAQSPRAGTRAGSCGE
jgi:hypothetical protein